MRRDLPGRLSSAGVNLVGMCPNLPTPPQRILIIRPSALGDVCRSVCVPAALRRALPNATIDWLVQEEFAAAIEAHPAINDVIAFPRKRLSSWWRRLSVARELKRWLGDLRRRRYDLVLDCQGLGRSGVFSRATRAPRRVGSRTAREFAWLNYTDRVATDMHEHTVDQTMALVAHLGLDDTRDMTLYVPTEARDWWAAQCETLAIGNKPYAVLAPTSRWPSKRWPDDRFAALLGPLGERGFAHVVVIGAPGERDQIGAFLDLDANASPRVHNLVGELSVAKLMAVIGASGLLVANDSAPLHLAVGFDRPCLGLFGPTEPAKVGPYRRPEAVLWKYDPATEGAAHFKDARLGDRLMRLIEVDDALRRIDDILATAPNPRPTPPPERSA